MPPSSRQDGRVDILAYFTSPDNSRLYRAIVDVFARARARYELHRRPAEVLAELREHGIELPEDEAAAIERRLDQLVEWGNLDRTQLTGGARTLQEWRQRRFVYHVTPAGERIHRAVTQALAEMDLRGSLQAAGLDVVHDVLRSILAQLRAPDSDGSLLAADYRNLGVQFNALHGDASAFLNTVQRLLNEQEVNLQLFHSYKIQVLEYIERFIDRLTVSAPPIAETMAAIEEAGVERLFRLVSDATTAPPMDGEREDRTGELAQQWRGLRAWFQGAEGRQPNYEGLRAEARAAVGRVLGLLERLAEMRSGRISRRTDLIHLARQFMASGSEQDAHRLFRDAFGLFRPRHLAVTDGVQTDPTYADLPRDSWWIAPAANVSLRLREAGPGARAGRPSAIENLASQRQRLAGEARQRRLARDQVLTRLVGLGRRRLSELPELEPEMFQTLVQLLAFAVTRPRPGQGRTRTASRDGRLVVEVESPADGAQATLVSTFGRLIVPDYVIEVVARQNGRQENVA